MLAVLGRMQKNAPVVNCNFCLVVLAVMKLSPEDVLAVAHTTVVKRFHGVVLVVICVPDILMQLCLAELAILL